MAGCKVLGIINKFISAPLWRVTESKGHILDMSDIYCKLDKVLSKVTSEENEQELIQFAKGEITCFSEDDFSKDDIFLWILFKNHQMTPLAARHTLNRMTKDFLPGGKYHAIQDAALKQETASVPKHNKLPERIFGYLGYLMEKRPNSADITNEAQVMFLFNKTSEYVNSLSPEKLESMIAKTRTDARKYAEKKKQKQNKTKTKKDNSKCMSSL